MKLILASQSPRRRELLSYYTNDFQVKVSQADESLPEGIAPGEAVALLAERYCGGGGRTNFGQTPFP